MTPNRPSKGTPEYELLIAACEVASYPPLAPKAYTCAVPAKRIEELRLALDALDIDWRRAKQVDEERRRARLTGD